MGVFQVGDPGSWDDKGQRDRVVLGVGFKVWGLGFKVWGLGFKVWGLRFGV